MIRKYEEERDFEMLSGWWNAHGWDAVNPGLLKPLGMIAEQDGAPAVASFLYPVAGCGLAIMEWTVSNPDSSPIAVMRGIRKLTDFFTEWCKENDYGVMMTTCKQNGLAKLHERNGFHRTDEDMIHLAKIVGGKE
jgi:hypothetical protein